MSDPVAIGTAIVAYIEPHEGHAREFNRWYERDHFYAAAMAAPGAYAGGRWVATSACKRARAAGNLFGDPSRGSYLATFWILPGSQDEWDAWVTREMPKLTAAGRLFPERDHLQTAVYSFAWDVRVELAPPPATALDHGFEGVVAIAAPAGTVGLDAWARALVSPQLPLVVALESRREILSTTDPDEHVLLIGFCEREPLALWRDRVEPALADLPAVGFGGPFLRTIPGTDTYVEDL